VKLSSRRIAPRRAPKVEEVVPDQRIVIADDYTTVELEPPFQPEYEIRVWDGAPDNAISIADDY
tara:strand:- start:1166 stop:1357 length:192 start_codon:yes stop_codon:yes gene_type:complete